MLGAEEDLMSRRLCFLAANRPRWTQPDRLENRSAESCVRRSCVILDEVPALGVSS